MSKGAIILTVALVVLGGVGFYYFKEIQLIQNITYQLIGFNVSNLSESVSTVTLDLRLFSQSTIDAEVEALFLDVYLDNVKLGSVQQVAPFLIPARGYSDAQLLVNFSPALLVGDALNLLTGTALSGDMAVQVLGYAKIKSSFLTLTIPFTYSTTAKELMAST